MRLLVIGTSSRAQITLNSQYASGYHAELIQLDNGDMFIVDKNSTNGTFVNGQKIEPDKEVSVTRGTNITFADAPLDWTKVPDLVVDRNAKALIGVGTHYRNKIRLSGDRISRFHATLKQTKDGKWWICDHSTNGTSVNGSRLPKDRWTQLKRGDVIKCAGQEIENPVPRPGTGKYIGIAAAAVAAVVAIALIIPKIWQRNYTDEQLYNKYKTATVMVRMQYHYHAVCPSLEKYLGMSLEEIAGIPDVDFVLEQNKKTGRLQLVMMNNYDRAYRDKPAPMVSEATGFFVSPEGLIATNLHVAKPWLFDDNEEITAMIEGALKDQLLSYRDGVKFINDLQVIGVVDKFEIIPDGQFLTEKSCYPVIEYSVSSDKEIDLAIIRLQYDFGQLPKGCTYVKYDEYAEPVNGEHIFTLGYSFGNAIQESNERIQAISMGASVSRIEKDKFQHDATTVGGSSGSPVFNRKGNLIGVHHAGYAGHDQINMAIKAKYVKRLMEQEANKQI